MNPFALVFLVVCSTLILTLPRRWALAPLIVGCCYMTKGQGIDLGGLNLQIFRMLIAVGVLRLVLKSERPAGRPNNIDKAVLYSSLWLVFASLFQPWQDGSGPEYAFGVIFNTSLVYLLVRCFIQTPEDMRQLPITLALLLLPVSLEMVQETRSGYNAFSIFGGVSANVPFRDGELRATGPFRSPILAGTVGGVCFPLMLSIWNQNKIRCTIGCAACLMMVFSSGSSGPVIAWAAGVFATGMYFFPRIVKLGWKAAIPIYLLLSLVMVKPPYYLIKRIDLTGSSTGDHRVYLIDSAIKYFSDWWLFGTTYTRHWMTTGVSFSDNHTDLTNHYIAYGVMGGFLFMLGLILSIYFSLRSVERIASKPKDERDDKTFLTWCFGAALFAHAATCISVSYFDQSVIFLWITIGAIASLTAIHAENESKTTL